MSLKMSNDDLPTFTGRAEQIPSSILRLFGLDPPNTIPSPIEGISIAPIEQVVLVILDNFGLFEITMYKPEFVIRESQYLLLFETSNPYTLYMLNALIFGGSENNNFHLIKFLQNNGKTVAMIGQESDLQRFSVSAEKIPTANDMNTWVQGSKMLNRVNFLSLHFLDFENLYKRSMQFQKSPPEDLISRLILRTSKWLTGMFKQLKKNSVMFILGTHGRTQIETSYTGKVAEWRKASLPIGVLMTK
jgi:hypothetical protein